MISRVQIFSPLHKVLLVVASLMLAVAVMMPSNNASAILIPNLPILSDKQDSPDNESLDTQAQDQPQPTNESEIQWIVSPGDNLSYIFQENGIPASELHKVMLADTQYLDLETLQPGVRLGLDISEEGILTQLILYRDPARKTTYTLQADGSYQYQAQEADTYWISEVHRGEIQGSLYLSAQKAGLSEAHTALISQLLGYKVNLRRDLRAGDRFTVVLGHEMTGETPTGQSRIDAISLERRQGTQYAFRFNDHYYDEKGKSITPAFLRWPTQKRFRISSHFNKNRLHPVTGRRAPHHGVDFAVMTGTPVISTGDGIIRRVGNHPYAGKYIDIDHGGTHTTRYLHLHRILVKRGSKVSRGQKIALSGNTGRSTGPHLHYEFHIKGRPVNPVTADIPTDAAVSKKDLKAFNNMREQQLIVMRDAASPSGLQTAQNTRQF